MAPPGPGRFARGTSRRRNPHRSPGSGHAPPSEDECVQHLSPDETTRSPDRRRPAALHQVRRPAGPAPRPAGEEALSYGCRRRSSILRVATARSPTMTHREHVRSTNWTGLPDGGGLSRPTCSTTTWTLYPLTRATGIAVDPMTPSSLVVPWYPLGASARQFGFVAVAPSPQFMLMHQLARGDAFSIATDQSNRSMTWRGCNQSHNSHRTKSCGTGECRTGFKLIQTRLIPCSRFMSHFRHKTC